MRVISLQEGANRSNQHLRTLQRQIAEGKGPPVVEISERRRGILESDFEQWLLARRRPVLEPPMPRRGPGRPRKITSDIERNENAEIDLGEALSTRREGLS